MMTKTPSDIAQPSVSENNGGDAAGVPIDVVFAKLKKLDKERTPGPWGADSNGRRDEDLYDFLSNPDGKIIADTCNADEREIMQEEDGPVDVRGGANMRFIEALENLWTAGALVLKTIIAPFTSSREPWRIVPPEPTDEMLAAGNRASLDFGTLASEERFASERAIYKAMLAASPASVIGQEVQKVVAERNAMAAALAPFGVEFMDPPDGGDVSVAEQLRRMGAALIEARGKIDELLAAYDSGNLRMESTVIDGDDCGSPHPWHEEWIVYARRIISGAFRRRWRHLKRGSTYTELGRGRLQVSAGRVLPDHFELVVYRAEQDGSLWCRPPDEFTPDRFEELKSW